MCVCYMCVCYMCVMCVICVLCVCYICVICVLCVLYVLYVLSTCSRSCLGRVVLLGSAKKVVNCITIIDTIILTNYTNNAYYYDTCRC
jgi:hypothetical protein